mgnify:FL=1|jgi:hypothetical protein|nr:MAG TPA: hypothetical protein [Caudoviricetes sp.]
MKTMYQKTDEANAKDYRFERFGESTKRERLEHKGNVSSYDGWKRYHLRETLNGAEYGWCLDVIEVNHKDGLKTLSVRIMDEDCRRYLRQNIPYTNDFDSVARGTLEDWNNIRG